MIKFIDFGRGKFINSTHTTQKEAMEKWISAYSGFNKRPSLLPTDEYPEQCRSWSRNHFVAVRSNDFPELPVVVFEKVIIALPYNFNGIAISLYPLFGNNEFRAMYLDIFVNLINDNIIDGIYPKLMGWFSDEAPVTPLAPFIVISDDKDNKAAKWIQNYNTEFIKLYNSLDKRFIVTYKLSETSAEFCAVNDKITNQLISVSDMMNDTSIRDKYLYDTFDEAFVAYQNLENSEDSAYHYDIESVLIENTNSSDFPKFEFGYYYCNDMVIEPSMKLFGPN